MKTIYLLVCGILALASAVSYAGPPQKPRLPQAPPLAEVIAHSCDCPPSCNCGCQSGDPCKCSKPDKDGWIRRPNGTYYRWVTLSSNTGVAPFARSPSFVGDSQPLSYPSFYPAYTPTAAYFGGGSCGGGG